MARDYGKEIDALQKELEELKHLLSKMAQNGSGIKDDNLRQAQNKEEESAGKIQGKAGVIEVITDMHPNPWLSSQMTDLCLHAGNKNLTGLITYLGVFSSGGRQSNWIRREVDTGSLLTLIENHTAEKVLSCIGNNDRLNILLAILKKPMSVAEIVTECKLGSTGQAYHHMKPLQNADLITEDSDEKGVYIIQPHKVQGIIMLLAGIADMVDETYTKGNWEETQA